MGSARQRLRRAAEHDLTEPIPDGRPALAMAALVPDTPEAAVAPNRLNLEVAAEASELLRRLAATGSARRGEALRRLPWLAAVRGHYARARERVAQVYPPSARTDLLKQIALLALRRRALGAAERSLEMASRIDPDDTELASDLGALNLARGRPERAVQRFSLVVARRPQDLGARRDLAGAVLAAGRADEALRVYERAMADADLDLLLEYAAAAHMAARLPLAERISQRAAERAPPDDGRAHARLGAVLIGRGQLEAARAAFTEALLRDPDNAEASRGLRGLDGE